jgi:hypothetical protein
MKDLISIAVPFEAAIRGAILAATAKFTDPAAKAILEPLVELMASSGVAALQAASTISFELHWPDQISHHARQTMRAQIKSEMEAHVKRALVAHAGAMIDFQTDCVALALPLIAAQLMERAAAH